MMKDGSFIQTCMPPYDIYYDTYMKAIGREDLVGDERFCEIENLGERSVEMCDIIADQMILKDKEFGNNGTMVFADCAVNPDPDEKQLAEIAITTAQTTKSIVGFDPRIAMLSFSTKGSAKHPMVDKVVNATKIARQLVPDIVIDGELQIDAAVIEKISKQKG